MRFTTSLSSACTSLLLSVLRVATSSSLITALPSSRYSFRNSRITGITSFQSVSAVLVNVTKLEAIKTDLINGKPNNSVARGEGLAVSTSGKSMLLPGYNSLFATNFMVSGFGVISVYMLIIGFPVLIISNHLKGQIYKTLTSQLTQEGNNSCSNH